ncbi:MAG: zinc-binding dehydrogenase [Flammeovirgaceae bacterium]|nr:zinc-binding dehydrogenase [Flammeovirgaceae bacterium]
MRAIILNRLHEPPDFAEAKIPEITDSEVLVKLKAAALNHRDVWVQKGLYPGMKLPCILGSDGAGTVEKVGRFVSNEWFEKEVIINPGLNWGENALVAGKEFNILGMPKDGCFAEYVKIDQKYLYEKPLHLNFAEAAAIPLAGVTAYRALFTQSNLKKGEKVLITGIGGGVAIQTLLFARVLGCEVYVTSGSDEKIRKAVSLGATGGINYKLENWHKALFKEAGNFDVIIDSAGGENFGKLIDLAAPAGRITFYGGTSGNIGNIIPSKVFFKQLTIKGTTMGSSEDFQLMVDFVNQNKIKPVIDQVFPIKETEAALTKMENGDQFGKIVVKI